jgi:flagellin-like protein
VENMKAIRRASKRVSRKAVSPVVATVILVLISVVAGVMLWLWVSGFTSSATAQQPALNERIKIEAVEVSGNTVTVYVRNVGSITVKINGTYLYDYTGKCIGANTATNLERAPGEAGSVTVTAPATGTDRPQSGYTYSVKVVTEHGVEATYSFVWP